MTKKIYKIPLVRYPSYTNEDVDYDQQGIPMPEPCPEGHVDLRTSRARLYPISRQFVLEAQECKPMIIAHQITPAMIIYDYMNIYGFKYGYSNDWGVPVIKIPAPWNLRRMITGNMGYAPELTGRWRHLTIDTARAVSTAIEVDVSLCDRIPYLHQTDVESITRFHLQFRPCIIEPIVVLQHMAQYARSRVMADMIKTPDHPAGASENGAEE